MIAIYCLLTTFNLVSGDCISKRYEFNNNAILDDFEYEQGAYEINEGKFRLLMKPVKTENGQPIGGMAGFKSKQQYKYGRFAARMKAAPLKGSISYLMVSIYRF